MLTMIIAAAATGLSVPWPAKIFSHGDYPDWALARDVSAASIMRLVVAPDGKVARCVSVREFGDQQLAKEVCRILGRKRFAPPTLRDGRKVHAFLDTMLSLILPHTSEGRKIMALRMPPDAELSVNKLPSRNAAEVRVFLAYDPAGKITDCAPAEGEKDLALANLACGQRALFDNAIRNDLTGRPVAYVTQKRFGFTVAPQPK